MINIYYFHIILEKILVFTMPFNDKKLFTEISIFFHDNINFITRLGGKINWGLD